MRKPIRAAALALALAATALALGAQKIDMAMVRSNEQFRLGVQAFHKATFNEAISALEKALSIKPGEPFISSWLGRAYWKSGIESAALGLWGGLVESGAGSVVLSSFAETVRARRIAPLLAPTDGRLVIGAEFPGTLAGKLLFQRPSAVLPLEDAGALAVAYGSNEVLRFDANGFISQRWRGPFEGFDRPFDIARARDGRYYLSEFAGNRVAILAADGTFIKRFGAKGRGDGQFVGPGALAVDAEGALYVGDYGNQRVQKFDADGTYLLKFGQASAGFEGLKGPAGILCLEDLVYVTDAARRAIAVFDRSGNFQRWIGEGDFLQPEGIAAAGDGALLVADSRRIVRLDLATERAAVLFSLGALEKGRITQVEVDANGSLIASDFDLSRVLVLHDLADMYAGLFVTIDKVDASRFPKVYVAASVQDRARRPVTGLSLKNFHLAEQVRGAPGAEGILKPAKDLVLEEASFAVERLSAVLVVERSEGLATAKDRIRDAASFIASPFAAGDKLSLVGAGALPTVEIKDDPVKSALAAAKGDFAKEWKFDLAIRLAGNELAPRYGKKAIFFVGKGSIEEAGFARYSLAQIAAYLSNNGIQFNAVLLENVAPDAEIAYLCAQTGGDVYFAYRPEGLAPVIKALKAGPSGSYVLSFTAQSDSNFGKDYMPLSLEAYLFKRSGRDELGYFAPLK